MFYLMFFILKYNHYLCLKINYNNMKCVNTRHKGFKYLAERNNLSVETLEQITHKYWIENKTDEYFPTDIYIQAQLGKIPYQESSENVIKLWERDYKEPKTFKSFEELEEARTEALRFFPEMAVTYHKGYNGDYVLTIRKPLKNLKISAKDLLDKETLSSQERSDFKLVTKDSVDEGINVEQFAIDINNKKPQMFTFKDGVSVKAPFKPNYQQEDALNAMDDFVKSSKHVFTLSGYAGTGKTSIIEILAQKMKKDHIPVLFCASTNKAAAVLNERVSKSGFTAQTLNKIFGISVEVDPTKKYNANNLINKLRDVELPYGATVIIDEASMIDEENYGILNEIATKNDLKLIYVGDAAQLAPPKDNKLSKVFRDQSHDIKTLTIVERTGDNAILKEATDIRNGKPLSGKSSFNDKGQGVAYIKADNTKRKDDLIKAFIPRLQEDPDYFRILAYSNRQVSAYNTQVRKLLGYNDNVPRVNEPIVGYTNWGFIKGGRNGRSYEFVNSEAYKVTEVQQPRTITTNLPEVGKVTLEVIPTVLEDSFGKKRLINLIDVKGNPANRETALKLATTKSDLWNRANRLSKGSVKSALQDAANAIERFLFVNDDLGGTKGKPYQKKVFDFGYAMTVHKSQGSTFKNVLIDDVDIVNTIKNNEDSESKQYTSYADASTPSEIDFSNSEITSTTDVDLGDWARAVEDNTLMTPYPKKDSSMTDKQALLRQQLEYVAVSRASDTATVISNEVIKEDSPLNHLKDAIKAEATESVRSMTSDEVWKAAAEIEAPSTERTVEYRGQTYTIRGNHIYNKDGKEVYSKDRNIILAKLAEVDERAVKVNHNGRTYYVDNKKNIISETSGIVMKWGEENGDRKAVLALAEQGFRDMIEPDLISGQIDELMEKSGIPYFNEEDMERYFQEHRKSLIQQAAEENKEMQEIKTKAIADGTFMKAPNGKDTKLTERQWLQVRTKNFIKWFGDWINDPANASKVVDENGEPLVVYHTGAKNIQSFNTDIALEQGKTITFIPNAIYTTDSAETSISYEQIEEDPIGHYEEGKGWVYDPPTYLSQMYGLFVNMKNPRIIDAEGNNWNQININGEIKSTRDIERETWESNYDGVIIKNVVDYGPNPLLPIYIKEQFAPSTVQISFNPNQVKSATANNGEFSPFNNDIQAFMENSLYDDFNPYHLKRRGAIVLSDKVSDKFSKYLEKSRGVYPKEFYDDVRDLMYVKSNNRKNSIRYDIVDSRTGEVIEQGIPLYTKEEYIELKKHADEINKEIDPNWKPSDTHSFAFRTFLMTPSKGLFKFAAKQYLREAATLDKGEKVNYAEIVDKFVDSFSDDFWKYVITSTLNLSGRGKKNNLQGLYGAVTAEENRDFLENFIFPEGVSKKALIYRLEQVLGIKIRGRENFGTAFSEDTPYNTLLREMRQWYNYRYNDTTEEESIALYAKDHGLTVEEVKDYLKKLAESESMAGSKTGSYIRSYSKYDSALINITKEYNEGYIKYLQEHLKDKVNEKNLRKLVIIFNRDSSSQFISRLATVLHEPYHVLEELQDNTDVRQNLQKFLQTQTGKEIFEDVKNALLGVGYGNNFEEEFLANLFAYYMTPKELRADYLDAVPPVKALAQGLKKLESIPNFDKIIQTENVTEFEKQIEHFSEEEKVVLTFFQRLQNAISKFLSDIFEGFSNLVKEIPDTKIVEKTREVEVPVERQIEKEVLQENSDAINAKNALEDIFSSMYAMMQASVAPSNTTTPSNTTDNVDITNASNIEQRFQTPEGEIYGFVDAEGNIYIDRRVAKPEHRIHEYTHLWDRMVISREPELWKRGVNLMQQFDNGSLWNEILNSEQYGKKWQESGITGEQLNNLVASEVHARLVGKNGEALLKEVARKRGQKSIINKLKQWMLDVWKSLKATFSNWKPEDIKDLTLEDFNQMTLRDFADGLNFGKNTPMLTSKATESSEVSALENTTNRFRDYYKWQREHVSFDKGSHTYYIDGKAVDFAVTEYKDFVYGKPGIDGDYSHSLAMGNTVDELTRDFFTPNSKWEEKEYHNLNDSRKQEVVKYLRRFKEYLDKTYKDKDGNPNYKVITSEIPLVGEITVNGERKTIAGTPDMIVIDGNGNPHIYDMKVKRNSINDWNNRRDYTFQLNAYRQLIESILPELAGKIEDLHLIWFDTTYPSDWKIFTTSKTGIVTVTDGALKNIPLAEYSKWKTPSLKDNIDDSIISLDKKDVLSEVSPYDTNWKESLEPVETSLVRNTINKQQPVQQQVVGENISSKGSDFAKRLTNPFNNETVEFRGTKFDNAEHAYQTWKSGKFDQKGFGAHGRKVRGTTDYNSNYQTMVEIITAKLQQHPDLIQGITERGGMAYLNASTHNVVGDGYWETSGQNKFMEALKEAYQKVQETQKQVQETRKQLKEDLGGEEHADAEITDTVRVAKKGLSFEEALKGQESFFSKEEQDQIKQGLNGRNLQVMSVSRLTDPAFFSKEIISFLEKNAEKPLNDPTRVTAIEIWSKHDGLPIKDILDACKKYRVAPMVSFSITGLGGTALEGGVMKYQDMLKKVGELIKNGTLNPTTTTIRIDPILPGITNMDDIVKIVETAKSYGIKKFVTSLMQSYGYTVGTANDRKVVSGIDNALATEGKTYDWDKYYGRDSKGKINFKPKQEVIDEIGKVLLELDKDPEITIQTCAFGIKGLKVSACLDPMIIERITGVDVLRKDGTYDRDTSRPECMCYGCHGDFFKGQNKKCFSSCAYCYAAHSGDNKLNYYNEDGTLKDNDYTRTERLAQSPVQLNTVTNQVQTNKTQQFVNHSGGAEGSDSHWGEVGERYGVKSNHYYHGNKTPMGNTLQSEEDFKEGVQKAKTAAQSMERVWKDSYTNLMARNWNQVKYSDSIFAIGHIVKKGEKNKKGYLVKATQVDGGTGYAVQMAINEGKPVYVFDQERGKWYKNINGKWSESEVPVLTPNFAGIGTRDINEAGKKAIEEVYDKTFNKQKQDTPNSYEGDVTPDANTIFVFGSNLKGIHGAGAARTAKNSFGAKDGVGEGLTGDAYALPTKDLDKTVKTRWYRPGPKEEREIKEWYKDHDYSEILNHPLNSERSISPQQIIESIKKLYDTARKNPDKQFKVSNYQLGQISLNGYIGEEMREMFIKAGEIPSNVLFSKSWTTSWPASAQQVASLDYSVFNAPKSDAVEIKDMPKAWKTDPSKVNASRRIYLKGQKEKGYFEIVKDIEENNYSVHFKPADSNNPNAFSQEEKQILFQAMADIIPEGANVSTWGEVSKGGIAGLNRLADLGFVQTGIRSVKAKGNGEDITIPIYTKEVKKLSENGKPMISLPNYAAWMGQENFEVEQDWKAERLLELDGQLANTEIPFDVKEKIKKDIEKTLDAVNEEDLYTALSKRDAKKLQEKQGRLTELNRSIDRLQNSSILTPSDIHGAAKQIMDNISDMITRIQDEPSIVKTWFPSLELQDDVDFTTMTRKEIVETIGIGRFLEAAKKSIDSSEVDYDDVKTEMQADLFVENWNALIQFGNAYFKGNEGYGIQLNLTTGEYKTTEGQIIDSDNFNADSDPDRTFETTKDEQEHWQIEQKAIDIMNSPEADLIKIALHNCYEMDENGQPILSKWGKGKVHVDKRKAITSILSWVQGELTIKDMYNKLAEKQVKNPWLSGILDKLNPNNPESAYKNSKLQSLFFNVMCKSFQRYSFVQLQDGRYIAKPLNDHPAQTQVIKTIEALFNINEHPLFQYTNGNGNVIKGINIKLLGKVGDSKTDKFTLHSAFEELSDIKNRLEEGETFSAEMSEQAKNNISGVCKILGFVPENSVLNAAISASNVKYMTDKLKFIVQSLDDAYKKEQENLNKPNVTPYEPFKFKGDLSIEGSVRNFFNPITNAMEEIMPNVVYDDGKLYQAYVTPSFLSLLMQKFHWDTDKFNDFIEKQYGYSEWFKTKDGYWRNDMLRRMATDEKARKAFSHTVELNLNNHRYMKNLSDIEYAVSLFAHYWGENTRKGDTNPIAWFRMPMQSNKPSSEFFSFYSYRGANYKKNIVDGGLSREEMLSGAGGGLYGTFLQEMERIKTVLMRNKKEEDPDYIQNFDKFGRYFNFLVFLNPYLASGKAEERTLLEETAEYKEKNGITKNENLAKLIQKRLEGEKAMSGEELLEMGNLAREAIRNALEKKAQKILDNWEETGILEAAKKVSYIANEIKDIKDEDAKNAAVRELLENFIWNDHFAAINILQLTIGDIAFYKNAEDLQKRLSQLHAPGIRPNVFAVVDNKGTRASDGKYRTLLIKDYDSFITNIIQNLEEVFDRRIANAKTAEEKKGWEMLKEDLVGPNGKYRKINVTDAQGYNSITSYRKKAIMFGRWSSEAEEIYQTLARGDKNLDKVKIAFQPLKPFVYTQLHKDIGVRSKSEDGTSIESPIQHMPVPLQAKNSEYLLIMADALLKGEELSRPNLLRAIFRVMEDSAYDNREYDEYGRITKMGDYNGRGIDTIQFESAIKSGKQGVINLNQFLDQPGGEESAYTFMMNQIYQRNDKGKLTREYNTKTFIHETDFESYCLQQDVPGHFRNHYQAQGSQERMIIPSDLEYYKNPTLTAEEGLDSEDNINYYGKYKANEIRREIENVTAANINLSIKEFKERLKWDSASEAEKNMALSEILQEEILDSTRYGIDMFLACGLDENGEFRIPLGDPIQAKRIEQLLNSIIKNSINKQEIAGGPIVQVSNYGVSRQLQIKFHDKKGGILLTEKEFEAKKNTKAYEKYESYDDYKHENQAGIAYFEVFAPAWMRSLFKYFTDAYGNIDLETLEILNPDLLKMISYRIPTEDKYSIAPMKLVGFMPKEAGDALMLPYEITEIDDSDFDIDKRYVMRKVINIEPMFEVAKGEAFGKALDRYIKDNKSNLIDNIIRDTNIKETLSKEEEQEIKEGIGKSIELEKRTAERTHKENLAVIETRYEQLDDANADTTWDENAEKDDKIYEQNSARQDRSHQREIDRENKRYEAQLKKIEERRKEKEEREKAKALSRKIRQQVSDFLYLKSGKFYSPAGADDANTRAIRTAFLKQIFKLNDAPDQRTVNNNKIIDLTWDVLTNEKTASMILNPGGYDNFKKNCYMILNFQDLAKDIHDPEKLVELWNELKGKKIDELKSSIKTNNDLTWVDTQLQFYRQNSAAASLLGRFAIEKIAHAILEGNGIFINVKEVCGIDSFSIAGFTFGGKRSKTGKPLLSAEDFSKDKKLSSEMTYEEYLLKNDYDPTLDNMTELDPTCNSNGFFVGKSLGSGVSASADAGKEDALSPVNINKNTINAFTSSLRFGMPHDISELFMAQKVIKDVLTEYVRSSIEDHKSLDEIINNKLNAFEKEYGESSMLKNGKLSEAELLEGMLDREHKEVDYKVLYIFDKLKKLAEEVKKPTFITRFNSISNAVGPLIVDNLVMRHKMDDMDVSNINDIHFYKRAEDGTMAKVTMDTIFEDHPILKAFAETVGIAETLFRRMPAGSSGFKTLLDQMPSILSEKVSQRIWNDKGLLNDLSNFYQSYLIIQAGLIKDTELKEFIEDFPKTFEKEYKKKYGNNAFVNAVMMSTSEKTSRTFLNIPQTGFDETVKDIYRSDMIELYKENPKLVWDLFKYAFFRGGINFSPKTWMNLVSTFIKERLETVNEDGKRVSYKDVYNYKTFPTVNPRTLLDQFVRNNWNDTKLVPRKKLEDTKYEIGNNNALLTVTDASEIAELSGIAYLKTVDEKKNAYLWRLLGKEEDNKEHRLYGRISPLGDNGEYLEMFRDTSTTRNDMDVLRRKPMTETTKESDEAASEGDIENSTLIEGETDGRAPRRELTDKEKVKNIEDLGEGILMQWQGTVNRNKTRADALKKANDIIDEVKNTGKLQKGMKAFISLALAKKGVTVSEDKVIEKLRELNLCD